MNEPDAGVTILLHTTDYRGDHAADVEAAAAWSVRCGLTRAGFRYGEREHEMVAIMA